jgi:hypothetical protein
VQKREGSTREQQIDKILSRLTNPPKDFKDIIYEAVGKRERAFSISRALTNLLIALDSINRLWLEAEQENFSPEEKEFIKELKNAIEKKVEDFRARYQNFEPGVG